MLGLRTYMSRVRLATASVTVIGGLLLFSSRPEPVQSQPPVPSNIDEEARRQFEIWTRTPVPANETQRFTLNTDYPSVEPARRPMPWEGINFRTEPERYLRQLLTYCLEDAENRDFNFAGSRRWFHTPWMAREPLRGLTSERRSRAGELFAGQQPADNFAVGYYNEYGGWTIGQVWRDRARPNPRAARFPLGTVSCKLLFTGADPAQVPYIRHSLVWRIAPRGSVRQFRLLQLDVAVRDPNANLTGWVFGTFMYLGDESGATQPPFSFADLTPVTLMWGNDPTLGPRRAAQGATPQEGWVNPAVAARFADIRRRTPNLSTNLGLFGRGNGPVDNPNSACLACHGRALDGGAGWTSSVRSSSLPFEPPQIDVAHDAGVRRFFRNLKSNQPFLANTSARRFVSLDYSLQLAVGLENYNQWRQGALRRGTGFFALMARQAAPPAGEPPMLSWIDTVPDAEAPKRGDEAAPH